MLTHHVTAINFAPPPCISCMGDDSGDQNRFLYNLLPDQPHISQTMAVYLQTCLDTEISATCQCVEKNHEMDWSGKIPISRSWSLSGGGVKHPFPIELCKSCRFVPFIVFAQNRAVDVVMCSARTSQPSFCSACINNSSKFVFISHFSKF